jgi:hypothetical protein
VAMQHYNNNTESKIVVSIVESITNINLCNSLFEPDKKNKCVELYYIYVKYFVCIIIRTNKKSNLSSAVMMYFQNY